MSNLHLKPNEVFVWLIVNDYITENKVLTDKFFKDASAEIITESKEITSIVPAKSVNLLPVKKEDWDKKFMDFIVEAQVPARWEDSNGNPYYLNKFSEAGLKVFRKALESGASYPVLVNSTKLYYKSSTKLKKAIGNYFAHGDWKTDYEALYASAQSGIDSVQQHIKEEISNGNGTQYSIG